MPTIAITHTAPPFISTGLHLAKYTSVGVNAQSKVSDDGPHIAVKTQCNNTPNGSPQFTQVPLQDHPVTICISILCPVPSLRSVTSEDSCNIPSCFHIALQGIYSCQHHCDVVSVHTTSQMLHTFVLLLIPFRNFSFIRIAVLPIHYAVCQPLQLSPCQEVYPQAVIKLPLEQPSNVELLRL